MPQPPENRHGMQTWSEENQYRSDGPNFVKVFVWRNLRFAHVEWLDENGVWDRFVSMEGLTPKLRERVPARSLN